MINKLSLFLVLAETLSAAALTPLIGHTDVHFTLGQSLYLQFTPTALAAAIPEPFGPTGGTLRLCSPYGTNDVGLDAAIIAGDTAVPLTAFRTFVEQFHPYPDGRLRQDWGTFIPAQTAAFGDGATPVLMRLTVTRGELRVDLPYPGRINPPPLFTINLEQELSDEKTRISTGFEPDAYYRTVQNPEPGTLSLLALGLGLVILSRRVANQHR